MNKEKRYVIVFTIELLTAQSDLSRILREELQRAACAFIPSLSIERIACQPVTKRRRTYKKEVVFVLVVVLPSKSPENLIERLCEELQLTIEAYQYVVFQKIVHRLASKKGGPKNKH